jgi:hypothetical protein
MTSAGYNPPAQKRGIVRRWRRLSQILTGRRFKTDQRCSGIRENSEISRAHRKSHDFRYGFETASWGMRAAAIHPLAPYLRESAPSVDKLIANELRRGVAARVAVAVGSGLNECAGDAIVTTRGNN